MTVDKDRQVYFGTHADQLEILDPFTGCVRKFKMEDTKFICKVADALPNIHFILSVGISSDISPRVQSQVSFLETVKNFRKPINFSTNDVQGLKDIIQIASTVAGSLEKLQQKPFIFHYCEPIPPLTHPAESTEKLYLCAENRIPVVYMPYCMMGGTSVMSHTGTLVQCHAEVLTGLLITQLVSEGAPFIYGAMPSILDMRTTIGSYGAPEFHLLVAAASEIANHFGIPFYGTAGCSDAKTFDEQSAAEATFSIFSTLLSQANIVHDVGIIDHCMSLSPELVVFANEIIEGLKYYCKGIPIENDGLAMDIIEKVGAGGHFLDQEHTFKNFKNIWYPSLFSREIRNSGVSDFRSKIKEQLSDLAKNHKAPELGEDLLEKLEVWNKEFIVR